MKILTVPRILTRKKIQYSIEDNAIILNTESKSLTAYILKPRMPGDIVRTKIILAVFVNDTVLQFTFEPYSDIPFWVRTKNESSRFIERVHNFENMALLYAGQHPSTCGGM